MPYRKQILKVLVLAGGPDRERPVSLASGCQVAQALRDAGHEVRERDIKPNDLSALNEFESWEGDVIFPVLHGKWGEGGGLQHILDDRGDPYVGCSGPAAELCMDKHRTKLALLSRGLPTPPFQLVSIGQAHTMTLPVVVKAIDEGSSISLVVCRTEDEVLHARHQMRNEHPKLIIEQYIHGKELTVGVIGDLTQRGGYSALPPIQIIPATDYYDYDAKYERDDTRYLFDIDLPDNVIQLVKQLAMDAHSTLGVRHLCRVDFIVDQANQPWILEINTIPGFTSHSLLPMAARQAGIEMPQLVDRLARLAIGDKYQQS